MHNKKPSKKIGLVLLICLVLNVACDSHDRTLVIELSEFTPTLAQHPSDTIEFKGHIWSTELRKGRVSTLTSFATSSSVESNKKTSEQHIKSPHFLAKKGDLMYISAGWGKDIHIYSPLEQQLSKMQFNDLELHAPHGICIEGNWLYIADSLNSRLVRKQLDHPWAEEVFADKQQKIAYGRQIRCDQTGVWIVNSYENKPGLNKGIGANILLISDFASGDTEVIFEIPTSNATGMEIINNRFLIVGLWRRQKLVMIDLENKSIERNITEIALPSPYRGPPYGMRYSEKDNSLYVAFIGDLYKAGETGGIARYSIRN